MKTEKIKAELLIEDFDLYPRMKVDSIHVAHIAEAIESGADIPPIIADAKSKRIVDGVHRRRANIQAHGKNCEVNVILKEYKSDADMFEEAMRLNSIHGSNIQRTDRLHCIGLARQIGLDDHRIALALNITVERLINMISVKSIRVATDKANGGSNNFVVQTIKFAPGARSKFVSSKPATQHFVDLDMEMTPAQAVVNDKLAGSSQIYLARQLVWLFEENMIDKTNQDLLNVLHQLGEFIGKLQTNAVMA
jgi:hypothetical protein